MSGNELSADAGLLRFFVQRFFYPLALAITLAYILAEVQGHFGVSGRMFPVWLLSVIAVMAILERLVPLRHDWNMTRRSFFIRDLPMFAVNGAAIVATTQAMLWLARHHEGLPIFRSAAPWWAQALVALLVSDFLWYWLHRYCHKGKGMVGRWLWKTHALHHLPGEVYVLMHAAAHPLNSVYVRVILMLPALLVGMSPEAVFSASVFNGFQGLVSHFNVDIRAGLFNRLFVGTELHRGHHSAEASEGKNYAATFSIWDQLFGTYALVPGRAPAALGVPDRASYPADTDWRSLMKFPFTDRRVEEPRTQA